MSRRPPSPAAAWTALLAVPARMQVLGAAGRLEKGAAMCFDRAVSPVAVLLDPFWVGRRGDLFDEICPQS